MPTFRKKLLIAFPRSHVTQRPKNFKSYISLLGCKLKNLLLLTSMHCNLNLRFHQEMSGWRRNQFAGYTCETRSAS